MVPSCDAGRMLGPRWVVQVPSGDVEPQGAVRDLSG